MGSPLFAVTSLKAICQSKHQVMAVVTQPDKPAGRGRTLTPPAVKKEALELGIETMQPKSPKNRAFLQKIREMEPDIIVVVAYGKILKRSLFELPAKGTINLHASLLPAYRGAAPINWAIVNGEKETGVTIMQIEKGLDSGDMYLSKKTAIGPEETAGQLHDRLAVLGSDLLVKCLDLIEKGEITTTPQEHQLATMAPMLKKEDGYIIWDKTAKEIYNQIRGLHPWPGSFTLHQGKRLKIGKVRIEPGDGIPGQVHLTASGEILVGCGPGMKGMNGMICIEEIQAPGKKMMKANDFLRGHKISAGDNLGQE